MDNHEKKMSFAFFDKFTVTMFAQLSIHLIYKKMEQGEQLYKVGSLSNSFYFVVKGSIGIESPNNDDSSKRHTENSFFGVRDPTMEREDSAYAEE